jgi:hypothetical protein
MFTMKRNLVLFSCFLLLSASSALAQTTYQVTTVPTFVINTGRAEVLGGIRITATNAGPTVASTIQYTFQGVACDNEQTATGVTLTLDGAVFTAGNTAIQSVTNSSVGCVVAVTVQGGITTTATSYIEIDGVRGRIDFLGGISNVGQNINGSLSATPSNSSLFTVPNQGVVGITAVGLIVDSVTPGAVLQCIGTGTNPVIKLHEGFNGAFVQHVQTVAGSIVPVNPRPVYGGTNNTEIHFHVADQPTGVTLTWPATVLSDLPGSFTAGTALGGSELELLPTSTATDIVYEYACGDQAQCDTNTEHFVITPTLAATPTAGFGTATVATNLYPPLLTNDVTTITAAPFATAVARPRFNDPPRGPSAIDSNGPCTTNLLFPWMAFIPSAGYDTGFAIANTSTDPYGTVAQNGTCSLNFYPTNDTTLSTTPTAMPAVVMTTPMIASGATYAVSLGALPAINVADFTGYMIAVCNFQYGHGFGFITNTIGQPSALAQGYVALIIPDPVINTGRIANDSSNGIANSGEGLGQ